MDDAESAMSPEDFRIAAEEICGEKWVKDINPMLGAYHPDGPRDNIDDRLVRRWASGARPMPSWVPEALKDILDVQEINLRADADRKRRLLEHLGVPARRRETADREG